MQKYFYKASPVVKRILLNQLKLVNHEEEVFRAAVLAGLNNNPSIDQNQLYESIMDLTIQDQVQYAKANHLQQLFKHFNILHRYKRNMEIVRNDAISVVKDLVDPDKFPIFDLSYRLPLWKSNWDTVQKKLKKKLGFSLKVKQSSLRHADSGKGVFLQTKDNNHIIQPGTLLGFVPGTLYQARPQQNTYQNRSNTRIQYIHFTSNKILDLSKITIQQIEQKFQGCFKNPYAVGQYVNHPPPRSSSNVLFQQINIPITFFTKQFLDFLPNDYCNNIDIKQHIPAIGIFNVTPIKNGNQLFVNYLDHHIYPLQKIPQWLTQTAPLPPILQKNQYQSVFPQFWTLMQNKALQYHKQLYDKFKNRVKYEPSRVMYEHDKKQYRQLIKIKYDSFKD